MMPGPLRSTAGFTYIAALFMVVVMGIMLGAMGQSVKVIMQREKEKELIFRGLQYRDAIERWTKQTGTNLQEIKRLLQDPQNIPNAGLRKLYKDPMTGADFKVLSDPNLGIYGVASTSNDEPFKQGNFPEVIKTFAEKKKYSEWEFVFKRTVTAPAGAASPNLPPPLSLPLSTPEGN